jgi:hypothetical protein
LQRRGSDNPSPEALLRRLSGDQSRGEARTAMDDYAREMMELKTLVTRTLEKKGVLAKIRVSPSHFASFLDPDFPPHPFTRIGDRIAQLPPRGSSFPSRLLWGSGRRFISQICKLLCIISTNHVKKEDLDGDLFHKFANYFV